MDYVYMVRATPVTFMCVTTVMLNIHVFRQFRTAVTQQINCQNQMNFRQIPNEKFYFKINFTTSWFPQYHPSVMLLEAKCF